MLDRWVAGTAWPRQPGRGSTAPDTNGRAPEEPTDLRARSWWGVLKRTVREFREDNLTDWAAALTYYAILSIFPALLVVRLGAGPDRRVRHAAAARQPHRAWLPGPAQEIFTNAIQNLNQNQGAAGVLFVVGLATALWSASGYVGAFMRASNSIYEVEEGRPFWKLRPGPDRDHAGDDDPGLDRRRRGRPHRPAGGAGRQRDRPRRRGRDRMGHREVARAGAARQLRVLDPLLGGAQREAARLPLADSRRRAGRAPLDRRRPRRSRCTSRASPPTTRPTAASVA